MKTTTTAFLPQKPIGSLPGMQCYWTQWSTTAIFSHLRCILLWYRHGWHFFFHLCVAFLHSYLDYRKQNFILPSDKDHHMPSIFRGWQRQNSMQVFIQEPSTSVMATCYLLGINVAATLIICVHCLFLSISRTSLFPLYYVVLTVVQLEQTFHEKCPICEEK